MVSGTKTLAADHFKSCKLQVGASWIGLFVQHIQMLDWIECWGIGRPNQGCELIVFLKPFLNHFLEKVAGRTIPLKEATAIMECFFCLTNIHLDE